jgi:PhnB protein
MTQPSPPAQPAIAPMLAYADAEAAIAFLCKAFGFVEEFKMPMPDGRIGHAELSLGKGLIMLASAWYPAGFASPRELDGIHTQLKCHVDDVDAHYRRVVDVGATVLGEPVDQFHGERTYRAVDPEGHRWIFASPIASAT